MAPSQPPWARNQLGEQSGGRAPADRLVLGPRAHERVAGAVTGSVRRDARHAVGARRARRALSLPLFLAEHAPDRRGARALLRGHALPGAAARAALAGARRPDPRRGVRASDPRRRRLVRAGDRISALHARDLPPLPDAEPP